MVVLPAAPGRASRGGPIVWIIRGGPADIVALELLGQTLEIGRETAVRLATTNPNGLRGRGKRDSLVRVLLEFGIQVYVCV